MKEEDLTLVLEWSIANIKNYLNLLCNLEDYCTIYSTLECTVCFNIQFKQRLKYLITDKSDSFI